MQGKLNNKWGIDPNKPTIMIGTHPAQRYQSRIANAKNVREEIWDHVLNGTIVLEREGILYVRSQDKSMIMPCILHPEQKRMVVKTILTKDMNVFWKETKN